MEGIKKLMSELKERFKDSFYRNYLWYTALETELLFFVVCDAMFLTQAKQLTVEQVSQITFLSLAFSLLIQYPLFRFVNRCGNGISVRVGSLSFLLSSVCITFATGYYMVLVGGFLKCIGHTLNFMGTAIMKNHLAHNYCENRFVSWQSDANSAASVVMMITSFLCGFLFRINAYYPMVACIIMCLAGVIVSLRISQEEQPFDKIIPATDRSKYADSQKQVRRSSDILLFISFALFAALSGTGLSYSRLNFQELLAGRESRYVVSLLSIVSSLIYLVRFLSNILMRNAGKKFREKGPVLASLLMMTGLLMQTVPWGVPFRHTAALICIGYLLQAFVRDPYTTLITNISLDNSNPGKQQSMLIAINGAKKAGTLMLAAACTLILKSDNILYVMSLMTALSCMNIIFALICLTDR